MNVRLAIVGLALAVVLPTAASTADLRLPMPGIGGRPKVSAPPPLIAEGRRWLVGFEAAKLPAPWPTFEADLRAALETLGVRIEALPLPTAWAVVWPLPISADALAERLGGRALLRWLEPDRHVRPAAIPNDPRFALQWGLRNTGQTLDSPPDPADCDGDCDTENDRGTSGIDVRADEAWDLERGRPEVRVAVIDTGLDIAHPDLWPVLWTNSGEIAGNGLDDDGNGYVDDRHGWNACDKNGDLTDLVGHGTAVAAVAVAASDEGAGMAGLAPDARLVGIRALGPSEATNDPNCSTTGVLLAALEYALNAGVDVVNMSYGADAPTAAEEEKLRELAAAGIVLVAAAGNEGGSAENFYPSGYDIPGLVSVAAHTNDGNLASFSNRGLPVGIAAPGTAIQSAAAPLVDLWERRNFAAALADDEQALPRVGVAPVPGGDFSSEGADPHWGIYRLVDGSVVIVGDSQCAALDGCDPSTWVAHGPGLDQTLTSDPADLRAWGSAVLSFNLVTDLGEASSLTLLYSSDGVNWKALPAGLGRWSGNVQAEATIIDFTPLFGTLPTALRIRFHLETADRFEGSIPGGVYLWDVRWVKPTTSSDPAELFQFTQGTSLAAPFVSGAAALVRSRWPSMSAGDVVAQIVARAGLLASASEDELPGRARLDAAAALDGRPWLAWPGGGDDRVDGHSPQAPAAGEAVHLAARLLDPDGVAGELRGGVMLRRGDDQRWADLEFEGTSMSAETVLPQGEWFYRFVVTAETGTLEGPPARGAIVIVGEGEVGAANGTLVSRTAKDEAVGCGCRPMAGDPVFSLQVLLAALLPFLPLIVIRRRWRR